MFSVVFYIFMQFFTIYTVTKVALAQVEDGYLIAKFRKEKAWLTRKIPNDPIAYEEVDQLKQRSLTIPDTLRKLNMKESISRMRDNRLKVNTVMPKLVEKQEMI